MFAEEAHRHRATVMLAVSARIATKDLQLGDVTIPEGTDVRTLPLAGNLDPAAFSDPHHFDPTRFDPTAAVPARRHAMPLGFSEGIHYCLGAHLARAQTAMSLWMLKARFPDLVLAGPPTRKNTLIMRFVHRLPVRLRSAS
jgi:cytochrome P450